MLSGDDTGEAASPRTRLAATWGAWWSEAVVNRWRVVQLLPHGGAGLVTGLIAVAILLGVLPVAFIIATSVLIGRVPAAVTGGVGSPEWDSLVVAFLLAAGAFIGQQVLTPVQTALGELLTRRVDGVTWSRLTTSALRSTGIAPLEDQQALDALAEIRRTLTYAMQTPGRACAGMIALIARYLRLLVFVGIVGAVAQWWLGAALLVAVLVFRYGQRGGMRKYTRVWGRLMPQIRHSDYLRGIGITPTAAKELRIFGLTDWVSARYASAYRGWISELWAERRRVFLYPYLGYTAIGLSVAIGVLVALARGAAAGEISLTALALGLQATMAAIALGEHYPEADLQTTSGMRAINALERFEDRARQVEPLPIAPAAPTSPVGLPSESLRFEGLRFSYPGSDRLVLDGLDLELPAGRCTAIVGVNGAGKTTLVKLLTRLYEPTAGRITADGIDIAGFEPAAWRRQVSVIFQDFLRYELPAADNIAFGAIEADRGPGDDAVRQAAAKAGILDVLERAPRGLASPLARAYTDGIDLSGGQWQRVAIARSLFALGGGARVLVLDEPTSALDVRAEAAFFDQFVELTRGVTSLLISHRFSSVRRADRIVVIDGGRVVEQGSHDELMAADGHYARLFKLQAERFAAGQDAEGEPIDAEAMAAMDGGELR